MFLLKNHHSIPQTAHKFCSIAAKVCLVFVSIIFASNAFSQGNLLITPKRIIFDGVKRSEELNLVNIGKDSATFVVSFIQNRMKEDGSFEQITEPDSGQNFADKFLRFFPRTVTLAPGEAQAVKVQLTKSNELVQGEYRSHLYFRAVPHQDPLGEKEVLRDSGISVRIVPVFGISVPMIIRTGENTTSVHLSNLAFQLEKDTIPVVQMTFNRTGNMSVYGDIHVDHVSVTGKTTRVGAVKGMAVYTPNLVRNFKIALNKKESVDFANGKIRVSYVDQSAKAIKIAEDELVLKSSDNNAMATN